MKAPIIAATMEIHTAMLARLGSTAVAAARGAAAGEESARSDMASPI